MPSFDLDNNPTLETEQLESLLTAAGPEALNDIMEAFWRSTIELMTSFENQVAARDFDEAAKTAHALKGSSSNVGANLLAALAKVFENACRDEDGDTLAEVVPLGPTALERTRDAVEELVSNAG